MFTMDRRRFLTSTAGAALTAGIARAADLDPRTIVRQPGVKLKLALNAYSFDPLLRQGKMNLIDVVDFCSRHGVDALDPTAYYFPGYPAVPPDEYLYSLKRTAFINGVAISGTGVGNDFAVPEAAARDRDVQTIKNWIVAASKLGAPVIRIFSGRVRPAGYSFDEALKWMVADFQECAAYGQQHGVMVAVQPHHDFLQTSGEVIRVIQAVGSAWFACILDIGSLRSGDPYAEIEKLVPYAVSWQVKQHVYRDGKEEPTDLARIKAVIERTGYRGYLPFEALGAGNTEAKVAEFLAQIRREFAM